jgi:hypothetical protein
MLAWTFLLFWAYKKPLERRFVAPLTILILVWFFSLEVWAAASGFVTFQKLLPSMILQVVLTALYTFAYFYARKSASIT